MDEVLQEMKNNPLNGMTREDIILAIKNDEDNPELDLALYELWMDGLQTKATEPFEKNGVWHSPETINNYRMALYGLIKYIEDSPDISKEAAKARLKEVSAILDNAPPVDPPEG